MAEFKRVLPNGSEVIDLGLVDDNGRVQTANITTKFREAFESYTPNGERWAEVKGSGDLVMVDGNAVGASYLVISKDPLTAGTETTVTSQGTYDMPVELAMGLHMSQRTLGQEFSVEVVSDEPALPAVEDIAILNVSQATTTLTVNTVATHNLRPGVRIGIAGSPDSRMNYPSLVVASTPSLTQFTATAGPGGTIPSLTVGPFSGGFVYIRSATGYARNAVSMIFENVTATNASFYVKSESGDVLPGATPIGNHSTTIASTASVQAVNASYTYAFAPTTEYRLSLMADRFQWYDVAVDALGTSTSRHLRTQIIPDPKKKYKLRFRATNNKGLTVPVGQMVSIAKTGTTTATVVMDRPHGLTVADVIVLYGSRDQTSFPNLTTATAVASIVNATTFTVVIGTAVTATSYGGFVARVNGGNLMSALGVTAIAAQSVSIAGGMLTLIGSGTWGFLVGDLINLVGIRDNLTGASLSLDGVYRVRMISTTTMELEPIGGTTIPATLASTNCGGAAIRRTDLRVSFARIFDFGRQRVEMLARPSGDEAAAAPVRCQGGSVTVSGTATNTPVTPTTHTLNSAATTNATSVKTTAGTIYGLVVSNTSASDRFVKLYNKASAPTVGTDVPLLVIKIAAGDVREFNFGATGVRFATGIALAVTGLAPDADTTAIAAAEVKMLTSYV